MSIFTNPRAGRRWLALAALGMTAATVPIRAEAQTSGVAGQGAAAVINTALASQQYASATLPSPDGFATNSVDAVGATGTLSANALTTITSGMADVGKVSSQTSSEAANVSILNGLIAARQIVAMASSYANGTTATSDAAGCTVLGLVVNGVNLGDAVPAPNTRIALPGVGYVVLNEQTVTGNGATASGITVNLIHVVLLNTLTGVKLGEIIVGSASSQAAL